MDRFRIDASGSGDNGRILQIRGAVLQHIHAARRPYLDKRVSFLSVARSCSPLFRIASPIEKRRLPAHSARASFNSLVEELQTGLDLRL